LKHDKLDEIWADPKDSSVGSSHNDLKECCSNYLKMDIAGCLDLVGQPPIANSPEASALRYRALGMFPFLEYAVRNVLIHSNFSHEEGVDQTNFINEFEFAKWIKMHNIIEKFKIRCLSPDVNILYVLTEKNCSSLITIRMQGAVSFQGENGRYGHPIFAAIACGHQQAFEALLNGCISAGVDSSVFGSSDHICSFLVKHAKSALLHRFLSAFEVDPNLKTKRGESILSWTVRNNEEKFVEFLASQGANIITALHTASELGLRKSTETLLERGTNFNALDKECGQALHAASANGHEEIVELLLNSGIPESYGNPLCVASKMGHNSIARLLIDRGADVNTESEADGATPLCSASANGHLEVVQLLLDRGANLKAQDKVQSNALFAAAAGGHQNVTQLLLDRGVDVNEQGCNPSQRIVRCISMRPHGNRAAAS
jgi:ankyrin repeat protein